MRGGRRQAVKEGAKDAFARIIESKRVHEKDPDIYEFDTLRVTTYLCCYHGYRWTCYLGALTYLIVSIIYLIIFHSMINECEAQRNLWYYLLLSQCAIYGSTFWNTCIQRVQCAKSYFKILRHVVVTIVSFAFGSYGTIVLAMADPNNISQECHESMPYKFTDLIYATDILAYITGVWWVVLGLVQVYGVVGWLCKRRNKIKYSKLESEDDDLNTSCVDNDENSEDVSDEEKSYDHNNNRKKSKKDERKGKLNKKSKVRSTPVGDDMVVQDGVYRENYARFREMVETQGTTLTQLQAKHKDDQKLYLKKKYATQFGEFNDGLNNNNANDRAIQIEMDINDENEDNLIELGSNIVRDRDEHHSSAVNVGTNVNVTRRGAGKNRASGHVSPSLLGDGI